jgi:hypothetical protein
VSNGTTTLPDVSVTAQAPSPVVTTLQAPYAVRKIDLTFQIGTGDFGVSGADQLTLTGLRVYAHLEAVVSPHMASVALLRVYGMSLDHMNAVSVAGLLYQSRKNLVQVRAGDDASGMTTVFDGLITEAYPKLDGGADDRHFYVYATPATAIQLKPVSPSSYPGSVPASQVLKTLAQSVGYTLQDNGVTAVLQTPYLPGTVWQQIQAVVAAADCFAFLDSVNKVLITWSKNSKTTPPVTVIVGPQTGMINYPMFQNKQIIVRTLFSPSMAISPGTTVLVQSELKAANNAKLTLNMVTHELESQEPGGPWETILIGSPP